jgi:hypothetical protein
VAAVKIAFWGKIEGVKKDYYIIKAWNEFLDKGVFFYRYVSFLSSPSTSFLGVLFHDIQR